MSSLLARAVRQFKEVEVKQKRRYLTTSGAKARIQSLLYPKKKGKVISNKEEKDIANGLDGLS